MDLTSAVHNSFFDTGGPTQNEHIAHSHLHGGSSIHHGVTFGSWMKLWPERVFGGNDPVHACFKHSMTVWT